MTVVLWDGKGNILADKTISDKHERFFKGDKLFHRVIDEINYFYGYSGPITIREEIFLKFVNKERHKQPDGDKAGFHMLVITVPKGAKDLQTDVKFHVIDESTGIVEYPVDLPYGIGTGGDFAIGALYRGLDPHNAIKLAVKLDYFNCRFPDIDSFNVVEFLIKE